MPLVDIPSDYISTSRVSQGFLQQPHVSDVLNMEIENIVESSPMATPEIEDYFSSGSPSAGTPLMEVRMPMQDSSRTAKRKRNSTSGLARIGRSKVARCMVGSPALRIINQIQMSPSVRSPRSTTTQNSCGSRKLRSVYWKEFEPIIVNGEIVRAKCIHCHDYLSGKQSIGTSQLKKHLERCKLRSRVIESVDKMRAGSMVEWERSRAVCSFLKVFSDTTILLSGSCYPTAHYYFHQLWKIKLAIDKESHNKDQDIAFMAKEMEKKFMQYREITFLSFSIPVILDPRFKYSYVQFRINQFFGMDSVAKLDTIMTTLKKLFREYSSQRNGTDADLAHETSYGQVNVERDDTFDDWDQHRSVQLRTQSSNELSAYLVDDTIPRVDDFDILGWWKSNSRTYPILSQMARDVLSTPATTVPSESAFNTGERVVSDFRSRLSTGTVEGLICLQNWMRAGYPDKLVLQVVASSVYKSSVAVDTGMIMENII